MQFYYETFFFISNNNFQFKYPYILFYLLIAAINFNEIYRVYRY